MATTPQYNKTTWVNDGVPAINDVNLNKIEQGIADATDALRVLEDRPISVPDVPVGSVMLFAGNTIPADYAVCDGGLLNRTTSNELFTAIGTIYGVGDGSTTFNKPDMRGLFVRGLDSTRSLGSNQDDAIQNITGKITNIVRNQGADAVATGAFTRTSKTVDSDGGESRAGFDLNFDASRVVRTATETRPKNIAMYYIIRVQ